MAARTAGITTNMIGNDALEWSWYNAGIHHRLGINVYLEHSDNFQTIIGAISTILRVICTQHQQRAMLISPTASFCD